MADDAQTFGLEFIKDEPVHLPDDLVFLILSKLPLRSLKRFTCVCKLWALLFQNPRFMKISLNNFISNWSYNNDDTSLLLFRIARGFKSSLFSLSSERIQNMVKLEWPNPFQEDDPNFFVMGSTSVNGILCLYQRHGPTISVVVLWNPTTAESKVIPPSPVESVPPNQKVDFYLIGFGYDRVRDDYKVIRNTCCNHRAEYYDMLPPSLEPLWEILEIYSLRSNSWRTLDFDYSFVPHPIDDINRLYLDGVCHCICGHVDNFDNYETYLVSFDLSNEVFYKTSMPLDMPSSDGVMRYLLLLNESVAVISNPNYTSDYYISILGQVGMKESWTKLFVLESLPFGHAIGTGKKGNIVFVKDDDEVVQFDLSTHVIEGLNVKVANYGSR